MNVKEGMAAGVPYVVLPPDNPAEDTPLVAAWHLMDSPRSEAALAAALPLSGVDAWRVYFGLPLFGARLPSGGFDALRELAAEDYVLRLLEPVVGQAAAEFPLALAAVRAQLGLGEGPLGLVGGSAGGAVVLRVLAEQDLPVTAAAVINPVVRVEPVVDSAEKVFGFTYVWTEAAEAAAARLDVIARAEEIARRHPGLALLLLGGELDDPEFREPLAELHSVLPGSLGRRTRHTVIPDMGHSFAEEPGVEPAPQNEDALRVDEAVTEWFQRHLAGEREAA
ncbi:prolyl oligopeptidase family serine peptidase [Kutzneria viridogrisea]|uniref:Dienelactone hydrolase n=1 Tax=Kutzneria viridogrisea TaxID=47990 RepID=A0ABR6BF17_9PSEU|nr:dienelactone hydrolase [Kutzneria viridogrisea]